MKVDYTRFLKKGDAGILKETISSHMASRMHQYPDIPVSSERISSSGTFFYIINLQPV